MADQMIFPDNFMDFIKEYSFNDKEHIYTNGVDLIPVFRVEQAWDHYISLVQSAIDNIRDYTFLTQSAIDIIRECNRIIENNLYDINDII